MIEDIYTVTEVVEQVLDEFPETRNSDRKLLLKVWEKYDFSLYDFQLEKFWKIPHFESVRRTRQKIQESGKYPAYDEVEEKRKQEEGKVRDWTKGLL